MISMLKLRKIIQQLQNGKAIKQISKELRSSKNTIRKYKRRIDQSSKTYQEILSLDDEQLCNLLECQTGPFTTSDDRYPILASNAKPFDSSPIGFANASSRFCFSSSARVGCAFIRS